MSATKVKMLQIKRLIIQEPEKEKKRATDAVVRPEGAGLVSARNLWESLTDFLIVGGDFV